MADAFIGEIRVFPYLFNPAGWFPCDGRQMQITAYPALYSLLGIRWGGDGRNTFNLPNLNGIIPVGQGTAKTGTVYNFSTTVGATTVTLSSQMTPPHDHTMTGRSSSAGTTGMTAGPNTAVPLSKLSRAITPGTPPKTIGAYSNGTTSTPTTNIGVRVAPAYGNPDYSTAPHPNVMPSLAMGYFINWDGVYPVKPN